ncbi:MULTISPECIES: MerR family transcriptional regulator [Streptomyces]|uniref:MerR family transcriptional regulator n=1 Tax=Streptomyces koelreuteriae TaxID=2838015 RepID=A0ABX8FJA1_9ACTN|nr:MULTISPECIES: MerR family transcriptional regulator [Streptomyces]QWB21197.1 MerR family transcriptional regulator [Streptomyces koelreuteriae]UUA04112.1 MerR family transcriptional regulator [Streptomyces koelreuteriae]UUA11738.1 MerR family transcriptional regulator [Streptomyces sp. CRCS-T-1]
MDDERPDVLTIGRLARRTGVPVRTLRFWSDEGAVPPVARSVSGYRLYDGESVARVELVRTLRELGLGLDDVCRVLSGRSTVAEVADAHVAALDVQIRSLKVSRAVLSTVAKRSSTAEETALMNRLARLSAAERKQIIDEFKEEVFSGLDVEPPVRDRLSTLSIELPDDPTPEQVDAWIELAELVRDPGFRARLRTWMELNTPAPGQGRPPGASIWWARQVVRTVAEVRERGVAPEGPAAAEVLSELFGDADRGAVLRSLEAGIEAEAERYRGLVARVRGQASSPDATEELEWLARALRAADQT